MTRARIAARGGRLIVVHFNAGAPAVAVCQAYDTACGVSGFARDRWVTGRWTAVTCGNCRRQPACPGAVYSTSGARIWTKAEDARLRRDYPELKTAVLAGLMRRTRTSLSARAQILGLAKSDAFLHSVDACRLRRGDNVGARFRFPKGHVPANRGLRRPGWSAGRMKETQFKKGVPTSRTMPIGSTRLVEGYVYRKVSDVQFVPYTVNWKPEHHLLWTRRHGPIPAGHALRFKNGNRLDVRLGNLALIARRDLMLRNSVHHLPPQLRQTVQLLGVLTRQIRKREDHAEQD